MKILLCLYGTLPRSIKYTYESICNNIINPLNKFCSVDIYGFNLKLEDGAKVDNTTIDNNDISTVPFTYFEDTEQSIFDSVLEQISKSGKIHFMSSYDNNATKNAMRQLYSEYRVGLFLETPSANSYDLAIVIGPDYWVANKVCLKHIEDAFNNDIIYLSDVNPGFGLTNGFYFGKPRFLVPLLKRYQNIDRYFPCTRDYESLVDRCIQEYNIPYKLTNIVFFKVRANKDVHWQGFFRTHFLSNNEKKNVFNEFYQLELRGFSLHYYAGLTPDILRNYVLDQQL